MPEHLLFFLAWTLFATAGWPVGRAWRAAHMTSLRHAWFWLVAAWLAWLLLGPVVWTDGATAPWRHLALSLSACALTAVLGARMPGMAAWNFVVAGLLVTLLLPLAEQRWSAAAWSLDEPRSLFFGFVLAVGVLNHVPTRRGLSAILFGGVAALELYLLQPSTAGTDSGSSLAFTFTALAGAIWLAWLLRRPEPTTSPGQLFLRFRDRYGMVWGMRVVEQFNAAAMNEGWTVRLGWTGTHTTPDGRRAPSEAEVNHLLRAVLKRFMPSDD
jgi:hypothetical protein